MKTHKHLPPNHIRRRCPQCHGTGRVLVFHQQRGGKPIYHDQTWDPLNDGTPTEACGMCGGDGRIDPWDEYDGKRHPRFDDYYQDLCDRYDQWRHHRSKTTV